MSARRLQLILSERAQSDLQDIQLYTLQQWGIDQLGEYEEAINLAFETLRDQPLLGRARNDLRTGLRSYPILSHVILYRVEGETISVSASFTTE